MVPNGVEQRQNQCCLLQMASAQQIPMNVYFIPDWDLLGPLLGPGGSSRGGFGGLCETLPCNWAVN